MRASNVTSSVRGGPWGLQDDQKGLNVIFSTYDLDSRDRMDFAHFCGALELYQVRGAPRWTVHVTCTRLQQHHARLQLGLQASGGGGAAGGGADGIDLALLYKD